jgi:hypothetical protein
MLARQRWYVAVIALSGILGCAARRQPYQAQRLSDASKARIDTALAGYRANLALSVRLAQSFVKIGDPIELHLALTNNSDEPMSGCVGASRIFDFYGSAGRKALDHIVDHPYCKAKIQIDPHGSFEWADSTEVLDIGEGPARLRVSQSIVYGGECDEYYGCRDVDLNAEPVPFTITGAQK